MADQPETTAVSAMPLLPYFENPPLVETAASLQFEEIDRLRNAHLALFWNNHLRNEYPVLRDAPALDPEKERFSDAFPGAMRFPQIRFGPAAAATRLQATSNDEYLMAQVQKDRLIFNWRRLGGDHYPSWESTFPKFKTLIEQFRRYLITEGLEDIRPNQWEVVYVNHLLKGRDWKSSEEWGRILPGVLGQAPAAAGLSLESISAARKWEITPRVGRLYLELNHGIQPEADGQVLALQLLARGPIAQGAIDDAYDKMGVGRAAIVTTFAAVTSDDAHRTWRRVR